MYEPILFLHGKNICVTYFPGTFGNFIKFFVEKFTRRTPYIEGDPFTEIGTSHRHGSDNQDIVGEELIQFNMPVCIIMPETDIDLLFIEHSLLYRVADLKIRTDELWTKPIGEMPKELQPDLKNILNLYDVKDREPTSKLPKFLVRDYYKLSWFNNRERKKRRETLQIMTNRKFYQDQRIFELRMDALYDQEKFISNMKDMDKALDLDLDFTKEAEMRSIFAKGFRLDFIRQECQVATRTLAYETDMELPALSVLTEAFIYAGLEKNNPEIQMPLTNEFFKNTNEIQQYLTNFPNWYRRPNPNLTKN